MIRDAADTLEECQLQYPNYECSLGFYWCDESGNHSDRKSGYVCYDIATRGMFPQDEECHAFSPNPDYNGDASYFGDMHCHPKASTCPGSTAEFPSPNDENPQDKLLCLLTPRGTLKCKRPYGPFFFPWRRN